DDALYGGRDGDTLAGGQGNDMLYADSRNRADTITDTFVWNSGDAGAAGAPALDTVIGFGAQTAASGGDVLDLSGLLAGVEASGAALLPYIDVQVAAGSTVFRISTEGGFAGGSYGASAEDQRITIDGVNLYGAFGVSA